MVRILLFTILSFGTAACQSGNRPASTTTATSNPQLVDAKTFKEKLAQKNNPILVDIRTPEEYSKGFIDKAMNIDFYAADFRDRMDKLDKSRPIFVYCHSGGRSGKSVPILQELGFKEIYDLDGGYSSWQK